MTDIKNEKPFFAQYVETQEFPSAQTGVRGGKPDQTQKAPSDRDEI